MSDALSLYRLRTTKTKGDCELDNGLSAHDEWGKMIITLPDDSDNDDEDADLLFDDAEAEASISVCVY